MNYVSEHVILCVNAVSLRKLHSSVRDDISNVYWFCLKSLSLSCCLNLCAPW